MTKFFRGLFAVLRVAGLIGIVVLFLHVEWRFVHGNFANFFKPLVQLFVIGSCLILPLFWLLVGITLASHFGNAVVRKRIHQMDLASDKENTLKDLRYLDAKDTFLGFASDVLGRYFSDKEQLKSLFDHIQGDEEKNKFLKIASFYKFLVKDGKFYNEDARYDQHIKYLDTTYKFIAIFSFIEALYSKEQHIEFYDWLKKASNSGAFPIVDKQKLETLYENYKREYGSTQKAVRFFDSLDEKDKNLIREKLRVGRGEGKLSDLARLLYRIRSNFVHRAKLIVQFGKVPHFFKDNGKVVQVHLSLEDLQIIFEHGLLRYFGYVGGFK